ncbi:MAG: TIM barrel protein [Pirellulales bacterium]
MRIVAFTKSFQDWTIDEVCRRFKAIGLDGLDLTVRPGGHIEPAHVERQLPLAVEAAGKHGLRIDFLTTSITDPDDDAEKILATAMGLGIERIKLGYYSYGSFGTLAAQMDQVRKRLGRVIEVCHWHGVLPCVHIHSGGFIPSHGTMLYELLRDFPANQVGAYVDTLHMTLEGSGDGWRQGLDLLAPWIALVAVKNFAWHAGDRDAHGQVRWHHRVVPVADGVAALPDFVAALKKLGYDGTYSLHSEYKGGHSFQDLDTEGCARQTAADFEFFKKLF